MNLKETKNKLIMKKLLSDGMNPLLEVIIHYNHKDSEAFINGQPAYIINMRQEFSPDKPRIFVIEVMEKII